MECTHAVMPYDLQRPCDCCNAAHVGIPRDFDLIIDARYMRHIPYKRNCDIEVRP